MCHATNLCDLCRASSHGCFPWRPWLHSCPPGLLLACCHHPYTAICITVGTRSSLRSLATQAILWFYHRVREKSSTGLLQFACQTWLSGVVTWDSALPSAIPGGLRAEGAAMGGPTSPWGEHAPCLPSLIPHPLHNAHCPARTACLAACATRAALQQEHLSQSACGVGGDIW